MELDRAAGDVCSALIARSAGAILLKGPTFARWLYADSVRDRLYTDIDVLAPADDRNGEILEDLGFEWVGRHPMGVHTTWLRGLDNVSVELHSTLLGLGASDGLVWEVLSTETESFWLPNALVIQLNEKARALHACLHAAAEATVPQPVEDLRRTCTVTSPDLWFEITSLARGLDALDAFALGLSLVDDGRKICQRWGIPANQSVNARLRADDASDAAQMLGLLDDARGLRAKLHVLGHAIARRPLVRMGLALRAMPEWWKARRSL